MLVGGAAIVWSPAAGAVGNGQIAAPPVHALAETITVTSSPTAVTMTMTSDADAQTTVTSTSQADAPATITSTETISEPASTTSTVTSPADDTTATAVASPSTATHTRPTRTRKPHKTSNSVDSGVLGESSNGSVAPPRPAPTRGLAETGGREALLSSVALLLLVAGTAVLWLARPTRRPARRH